MPTTKTFTRNNRTYIYTRDTSDCDSDDDYINASLDPNDSDDYSEEEKGPSTRHLYKGKNKKHHEIQTQPYKRKTRQERDAQSPRFTHTYVTEELEHNEDLSESATQVDGNRFHPLARTRTPIVATPLPEESHTDFQTTHQTQTDLLESLATRFEDLGIESEPTEDNNSDISEFNMSNNTGMQQQGATSTSVGGLNIPDVEYGPEYPGRATQKMPDPEQFHGERNKLATWLTQLNIKINGDGATFANEKAKIYYACALLRDAAAEWAAPYIENIEEPDQQPRFDSIDDFKRKIKASLGDPNPQATAEDKIRNLRQGSRDCAHYFTEFSQYVHKLAWDDTAKIAQFKWGMDAKIADKLIGHHAVPTDFAAFAQLCIELDVAIKAQQRRNTYPPYQPRRLTNYGNYQRPQQPNARNLPNWVVQGTRPGQWQNKPKYQYVQQTTIKKEDQRPSNPQWHGPAKMVLDAIKRNNACFNCGKTGHYARNCLSKGQNGPRHNGQPSRQGHPSRNGPPRQIKTAKRSHDQSDTQDVGPTESEIQWIKKNPLDKECYHMTFTRSSDGALYQKFLNQDRYEKTRKIRTAEYYAPTTNYIKAVKRTYECTANWCKTLGSRKQLGISPMTFGRKCDRACKPFTCTRCGKTRQQEQDSDGLMSENSLATLECSSCRHGDMLKRDETTRIANALRTGRIPRGSRTFIDEIEEEIKNQTDHKIIARLRTSIGQLRANEEEELMLEDIVPVHSFIVKGSKTMEARVCPVCYETDQEYISSDGRITACEECAQGFTRVMKSTTWQRIQPKN